MKMKKRLAAAILSVIAGIFTIFPAATVVHAASASVWYTVHVQDIGWMTSVHDGVTCGTEGRSLRAEAIQMDLGLSGISGGITYRTHIQDIGWTSWVTNRMTSGTTGQSLRMEAIQAKLTGDVANSYDLCYRVHVQDIGWMDWVKNGAVAGTTGRSLRVEAVQMKLIPKGSSEWQMPMSNAYVSGNDWLTYYKSRQSRPYHMGLDLKSRNGDSNVYAASGGTVAATGRNSANGNYVILKHTLSGKTVYSFYCHLDSYNVAKNSSISRGQKIGVYGNTGTSSAGAHLHFAIMDKLNSSGGYYGYGTISTGDKVTYNGTTFYNPHYVIRNGKLP